MDAKIETRKPREPEPRAQPVRPSQAEAEAAVRTLIAFAGDDGQADAIVGNRIAEVEVVQIERTAIDMQSIADFAGGEFGDAANRRDDSREHGSTRFRQKSDFITPD